MAQNIERTCHKAWNMIWMGVTGVIIPTGNIQDVKHMFTLAIRSFRPLSSKLVAHFTSYLVYTFGGNSSGVKWVWVALIQRCWKFCESAFLLPTVLLPVRWSVRPVGIVYAHIFLSYATYTFTIVSMMRIWALHLMCHKFLKNWKGSEIFITVNKLYQMNGIV